MANKIRVEVRLFLDAELWWMDSFIDTDGIVMEFDEENKQFMLEKHGVAVARIVAGMQRAEIITKQPRTKEDDGTNVPLAVAPQKPIP